MAGEDQTQTYLENLESLLVGQFRSLQKLIEITRQEREVLLGADSAALLKVVDEKEAMLDQLALIEDNRRMLVDHLALLLGVRAADLTLYALLPHLPAGRAETLRRLSEGITTLADQARDLNYGSQALAYSRLDWAKAMQGFLIEAIQPDQSYRSPRSAPRPLDSVALGYEFRA
jgi:flagellar biosynthesis/type III secretory pathway chaperone